MHKIRTPLFFLYSLALLFAHYASPTIHDLRNFKELLPIVRGEPSELVVFDIDNTLLLICDERANEQFFIDSVKKNIAAGKSPQEALTLQSQLWTDVAVNAPVIFTDEDIPTVQNQLIQKEIFLLAVTGRTPRDELVRATFRQLDDLCFSFDKDNTVFEQELSPAELGPNLLFKKGVLFADGNDKGTALKVFLEKTDFHPTHIYFIDDSLKNLESVGTMADQLGISYDGFHFTKGLEMLAAGYEKLPRKIPLPAIQP